MVENIRSARLLLTMMLFLAPSARAQIPTGKVLGTVRDETGAVLRQASVVLRSPVLFGELEETATNERGDYRFLALPPGDYTLEVRLPGFRPHREEGLRIEVGATIERIVTLSLGVEEDVIVRAEPPMVDRRESGVVTYLGPELNDQIPRRRSDFMDLIKLAPGVSPTRPTDRGGNGVSAYGSGTNENLFLIDGLDQTDPWSGQYAVSLLSTDSVQEVEIASTGASAEFGNFQGAVFNVVTRTGGNDFQFGGSYYHQNETWAATGPTVDCNCPSGETGFTNLNTQDATFQAGGPILRDRLWFFGNFQYRRFQENWPGSDPDFVYVGWEKRAFEKLSFQVNPSFTLRQTYQDGDNRYPDGVDATFPAEVGVTYSHRDPTLGFGASYLARENT
ncbi:MAG TPA: TonB-dependent receptor, partial [Vicinamibacteria bacterium]|nr:TonB-dependent receptor [Vicinamibacteria bacterium]